ncbi:MAG: hypothetical protein LBS56_00305 [Propionibacteriaceae bacterium]|jgi:hypothetical protein|nr:hypothetical protein [Propionibacteriaceae bacterium]
MGRPATTVKRATVSFREADLNNLQEVAEATRLTENDAIRKALATEAFVQEVLRDGGSVFVKDKNGAIREVVFVG